MAELSPNQEPNVNTKAERQILIELQNREIPLFKIQTITLFFGSLIFFHLVLGILGILANALITKEFPANDKAWMGIEEIGCWLDQPKWELCEGFCDNSNSTPIQRPQILAFADKSKCEHREKAVCIHNQQFQMFPWSEWTHCTLNHKQYRKRNIPTAENESTIVVDLRQSLDNLYEQKNC